MLCSINDYMSRYTFLKKKMLTILPRMKYIMRFIFLKSNRYEIVC